MYLCKCGETISKNFDFDKVIKETESLDNVIVRVHNLLCGQEGQDIIGKDLADGVVDRIVTVACSPKLHSKTFGNVCEKHGLNPYLLHMVNIREQCIWMTSDAEKATEKVIRLIKAGIRRTQYLEPLEQKEIDINPDVMVIGAGIAGVEAALELAKAGRKVYLVEKEPAFGGMLPKLEHTYPSGECAPCIFAPRIKEVMDSSDITVLSSTLVKNVIGFGGNFTVTVEEKPRYVLPEACISCMVCIEECPAQAPNTFNSNRDTRKAVDFYFPGCAPKAPHIDESICLRFKGEQCTKCKDVCDFNAIDFEQKVKETEIKVGGVIIAIGSQLYDVQKVFPEMVNDDTNVFTGLDFERMVSTTGATKGKIIMRNGKAPASVAIVHCVGSRNEKHLPYCSGICCKYALKHSHGIKEQLPTCKVTHVYSDLCVDGRKMQQLLNELRHEGVTFTQWSMGENAIANLSKKGDKIVVAGVDQSGEKASLEVDMVLLATGMKPHEDISKLVKQFSLSERGGFIVVHHEKISSIATTAEGIYIAGTVGGPKDITASVIEAKAAAGEVLATYVPGRKLKLEPMVAESDPDLCGACLACVNLCPYKAPSFDEKEKVVVVSDVLCKGCGTCVAACPTGAMKAKHYTSEQIIGEIEGVLT